MKVRKILWYALLALIGLRLIALLYAMAMGGAPAGEFFLLAAAVAVAVAGWFLIRRVFRWWRGRQRA